MNIYSIQNKLSGLPPFQRHFTCNVMFHTMVKFENRSKTTGKAVQNGNYYEGFWSFVILKQRYWMSMILGTRAYVFISGLSSFHVISK